MAAWSVTIMLYGAGVFIPPVLNVRLRDSYNSQYTSKSIRYATSLGYFVPLGLSYKADVSDVLDKLFVLAKKWQTVLVLLS